MYVVLWDVTLKTEMQNWKKQNFQYSIKYYKCRCWVTDAKLFACTADQWVRVPAWVLRHLNVNIYISDVVWHVCTNCKRVLRKFGGKNRVTSLCFHMGPNYTHLPHCFSFSLYHIMLLIFSRVISLVFFIIISVFSFLLPVGICLCFASAWRRPGWQLPRMLCDFQSIIGGFPQFTFPS